jgi:hypothetical protein
MRRSPVFSAPSVGLAVTTWYDRKKLYRMPPGLLEYVDRVVRDHAGKRRGALPPS